MEIAAARAVPPRGARRDASIPGALQTDAEIDQRSGVLEPPERTHEHLLASLFLPIEVISLLPDYCARDPERRIQNWATPSLTIAPDGMVPACAIETMTFESLRERSVASIWHDSPFFSVLSIQVWTPEPRRRAERRAGDHGGSRPKACLPIGRAGRTDLARERSCNYYLIDGAPGRSDTPARLIRRRFTAPLCHSRS
jgi:pyrroloquinoline quinone biosynthesis protein E